MNILIVTGNLGRDAQVREAGGTTVANFSVAARSGYGEREQTIWIDCSLWGARAESKLVDYLIKGQQVAVSGEMGTREYEGKTYITMRVQDVTLTGSKGDVGGSGGGQRSAQQAAAPAAQAATAPTAEDFDDKDVPF